MNQSGEQLQHLESRLGSFNAAAIGSKYRAIDCVEKCMDYELALANGDNVVLADYDRRSVFKALRFTVWIYFVASVDTGLIKIGASKDIKKRMAALQCGSPVSLDFLCAIRFVPDCERWLHSAFSDLREHGEWFRAEPKLTGFIRVATEEGTRAFLYAMRNKGLLDRRQVEFMI